MAPAAGESAVAAPADEVSPESRLAFAARLPRIVDGQLAVIERAMKEIVPPVRRHRADGPRAGDDQGTLQDIKATEGRMPADEADDDAVPRDIDEFRRELARRIRRFIESRR